MNGSDLKQIRESKGWTLRQMSEFLRDVSPSAMSLWERQGTAATIPSWIEERLTGTIHVTLPLDDLYTLMEHARHQHADFQQFLSDAIREYLARHVPTESTSATPSTNTAADTDGDPATGHFTTGPGRKILHYADHLDPEPSARVAED